MISKKKKTVPLRVESNIGGEKCKRPRRAKI
jgi:hypothetical protein